MTNNKIYELKNQARPQHIYFRYCDDEQCGEKFYPEYKGQKLCNKCKEKPEHTNGRKGYIYKKEGNEK